MNAKVPNVRSRNCGRAFNRLSAASKSYRVRQYSTSVARNCLSIPYCQIHGDGITPSRGLETPAEVRSQRVVESDGEGVASHRLFTLSTEYRHSQLGDESRKLDCKSSALHQHGSNPFELLIFHVIERCTLLPSYRLVAEQKRGQFRQGPNLALR